MSDPYEQYPHIRFVAPYSIQECRKRILENSHTVSIPPSSSGFHSNVKWRSLNSKASFKIKRIRKSDKGILPNYVELQGIFLYISDEETLVSANFQNLIKQRNLLWLFHCLLLLLYVLPYPAAIPILSALF